MRRAVHIAGQALVCAAGSTADEIAGRLRAGEVGCGRRQVGRQNFPYQALPGDENGWTPRAARAFAVLAEQLGRLDRAMPVFIASSSLQIGRIERAGNRELPLAVASFAHEIVDWLGLAGPPACFANACISGFSALAAAHGLIAGGAIDEALVVGCELVNDSTLAGFASMQLLSADACRPLDIERDGLVLGEAVAAVHLSAQPAPWRIGDVRTGLDGWSPTAVTPDGEPLAALLQASLQAAGLAPDGIELVKLQAAGSPATDLAEARALQRLFGSALPPLLSLKPQLGHTLGASGIAELLALLNCLDRGFIPPTPGFARLDPAIGMAPTTALGEARVDRALLSLVGFGGGLGALTLVRT